MNLHLLSTIVSESFTDFVLVARDYCVSTDTAAMALYPSADLFTAEFLEHVPEGGLLVSANLPKQR